MEMIGENLEWSVLTSYTWIYKHLSIVTFLDCSFCSQLCFWLQNVEAPSWKSNYQVGEIFTEVQSEEFGTK